MVDNSFTPKRIISLVPSQTELLFDLGLTEEVVGITKFCIHPETWFHSKKRVGGTKTVKTSVVRALQPDLIIANKEENVREQVEELQHIAPVLVTEINTLNDALEMIISIGKVVKKEDRAFELMSKIKEGFSQIVPIKNRISTAYFIWKDPYMAAGGDTFIHHMLSTCGFTNIFNHIPRYPEVVVNGLASAKTQQSVQDSSLPGGNQNLTFITQSIPNLTSNNCGLLLLSSEPYPFKQKHVDELQLLLPQTKIMLVDGEAFSWYGSRLLYSFGYFNNLIQQVQG